MKIFVKNNDINKALRILKKKLYDEGETKELRQRQHFVSDGERKRLDKKAGRKRWLKKRAMIERRAVKAEQQVLKNSRKRKQQTSRPAQKAN